MANWLKNFLRAFLVVGYLFWFGMFFWLVATDRLPSRYSARLLREKSFKKRIKKLFWMMVWFWAWIYLVILLDILRDNLNFY